MAGLVTFQSHSFFHYHHRHSPFLILNFSKQPAANNAPFRLSQINSLDKSKISVLTSLPRLAPDGPFYRQEFTPGCRLLPVFTFYFLYEFIIL
jgi:hypothetical protein